MLILPNPENLKIMLIETIFKTPYQFDLEWLAGRLLNVNVKLYENTLSIRKANYPHVVFHITRNGFFILAGTKTMLESKTLFARAIALIRRTFLPDLQFSEEKLVYNISGSYNVGFQIDLQKFNEFSLFKTQIHPNGIFVNVILEEPWIKLIVYASGKIKFDRCQQMAHIQLAVTVIMPILYTFRVDNDLQIEAPPPPASQQE